MSDDVELDPPAGGGEATDVAKTPDPAPTGTALGAAAGGEDPPVNTADALPDNWRDLFTGGDEKLSKRISRYTSPQNIAKALVDTQDKLRSGAHLAQTLPEDATPEEIAAYRKQAGVPDKPEGYGLAFPDDIGAGEDDAAVLNEFASFMHERHIPPGAAKAAFEFYTKRLTETRTAAAEAAQQATLENMAELRKDFSAPELRRNMKIADEFLTQHFSDHGEIEAVNEVLQMRLPNGVQVMNYAPFMKGLFKMARAYADDESLIGGDTGGGGKSLEDEKQELLAKSARGKLTKAEDARLDQIYEAMTARDARRNRAA